MSEVWALLTQTKKGGGSGSGSGSMAGGMGTMGHPVPKVPPNYGQGDLRRRGHR